MILRTCKTRLLYYLIVVICCQSHPVYSHLVKSENLQPYGNGKFPRFWKFMSWSFYHMLFVEHHYTMGSEYAVQKAKIQQLISEDKIWKYFYRKKSNTLGKYDNKCGAVRFGDLEHPTAVYICFSCLLSRKKETSAYSCTNCCNEKHSPWMLVKSRR